MNEPADTRELIVFGEKTFKVRVPTNSKITFGPFSPPTKNEGFGGDRARGTLRIYADANEKLIVAVFTGVRSFRDTSLDYMEEVAVEEGARLWKSDERGYEREEKIKGERKWITPALPSVSDDDNDEEEL